MSEPTMTLFNDIDEPVKTDAERSVDNAMEALRAAMNKFQPPATFNALVAAYDGIAIARQTDHA